MTYEKVLEGFLGECGPAQVLILSCAIPNGFLSAWSMVMMGFVAATPMWWSVSQHSNITSNFTSIIHKEKVCPTGNETVVFDNSYYTIVSEWQLICDKEWIPPLLISIQMAGVMIGSVTGGHLGDWIGRKRGLLIFYAAMLVFLLVQGYSVNWYMMAVCVFFLGIGTGGYLSMELVYKFEFVSRRWRTFVGALPAWGTALVLIGVIFKLLPNWTHLCVATFITGIILLLPMWFVPESIRWLLTKNRTRKAKEILKKLAARNNRNFVDNMEIETLQNDIERENKTNRFHNYLTLLKLKETRYKSLLFGAIWMFCSFSYYGLTLGVGNLHGDLSLNMILMGLSDTVTGVLMWFAAKFLQRRNTTIFLFSSTAVTSFVITISNLADATNYSKIKYGFALVSRFFLSTSWLSAIIFTVESFPTEIRSVGYSFVNFMSRFGGIAAAQNEALSKIADHLPFTVTGTLALVCCILCMFLKDTYTEDLPDYLETEMESMTNKTKKEDSETMETCSS